MTDYTQRRFIDQHAGRRLPAGTVDFMTVNNSNRRERLRGDGMQFHALWDKRTGDEDRLLLHFLLVIGTLLRRGIGEQRSSKHAGRGECYRDRRYERLHNAPYTRTGAVCKVPKRMKIRFSTKQERQWPLPLPLPSKTEIRR